MSGFWMAAGEWWVQAAVAGGAVLLLGWAAVRAVRQPARRQQAAGWAVRGAVLSAALSAFPAWLILPTPEWAKAPAIDLKSPAAGAGSPAAAELPRPGVEPPRDARPSPLPPISQPTAMVGPRLAERPVNPFRGDAEWVLVPADMIPRSDSRPPLEPLPEAPAVAVEPKLSAPAPAPQPAAEPDPPAPSSTGPTVAERVVPLLVFAYFAVAGVLLLQLVLGHLVLVRRAWAAAPLTGKARWVFDRLAESAGVRPRAGVSDTIPSPICFGFVRPTVLLPRHLAESLGEDELRWILAHELEHVRRGDHRSAYWAGVARAAFFFVPWLWPVRKELGLAQEYLADAAAAEAGGRPVDYAAFLVNLSGTPLERRLARPSLASTGVRAAKSDLFRRVNMLLNRDTTLERRVPRVFAAAAGAGVLAAAVGLSGVGFADEPKKAPAVPVPVAAVAAADPDEPPAPPAPPAKPARAEDVRKLKADIEKAIKDGKVDDAQKLLDKLEKAVAPPAPPAFPAAPMAAPRIAVPPAPPAPPVVVGRQGDWAGFQGQPFAQGQGWNRGAAAVDLKKQYEQQMKDFDKAIQDAKDDDARDQLTKARDEYKKAMEAAVKQADEAKAEIEKGQQMNRAGQARMQEVIEAQRRMQQELMKRLPQEFDRFQLDRLQNLQIDPNLFGNLQGGGFVLQGGQFQPFQGFGGMAAGQPRLGVRVDKVSPVLAEQLDLPKDTGLVLAEVTPGLPADKAGLKRNDVLLKLAGKDVPTDPEAFAAVVGKLKGGDKIDAVVLRKGKQTTVSGITLPEAKKAEAGGFNPFGGGNNSVQIQVNDEDVTINANTDGAAYAVTGRFDKGKLVPGKITVTEGKDTKTYESLDKVPEQHRGAIEKLMGRVRGLSR